MIPNNAAVATATPYSSAPPVVPPVSTTTTTASQSSAPMTSASSLFQSTPPTSNVNTSTTSLPTATIPLPTNSINPKPNDTNPNHPNYDNNTNNNEEEQEEFTMESSPALNTAVNLFSKTANLTANLVMDSAVYASQKTLEVRSNARSVASAVTDIVAPYDGSYNTTGSTAISNNNESSSGFNSTGTKEHVVNANNAERNASSLFSNPPTTISPIVKSVSAVGNTAASFFCVSPTKQPDATTNIVATDNATNSAANDVNIDDTNATINPSSTGVASSTNISSASTLFGSSQPTADVTTSTQYQQPPPSAINTSSGTVNSSMVENTSSSASTLFTSQPTTFDPPSQTVVPSTTQPTSTPVDNNVPTTTTSNTTVNVNATLPTNASSASTLFGSTPAIESTTTAIAAQQNQQYSQPPPTVMNQSSISSTTGTTVGGSVTSASALFGVQPAIVPPVQGQMNSSVNPPSSNATSEPIVTNSTSASALFGAQPAVVPPVQEMNATVIPPSSNAVSEPIVTNSASTLFGTQPANASTIQQQEQPPSATNPNAIDESTAVVNATNMSSASALFGSEPAVLPPPTQEQTISTAQSSLTVGNASALFGSQLTVVSPVVDPTPQTDIAMMSSSFPDHMNPSSNVVEMPSTNTTASDLFTSPIVNSATTNQSMESTIQNPTTVSNADNQFAPDNTSSLFEAPPPSQEQVTMEINQTVMEPKYQEPEATTAPVEINQTVTQVSSIPTTNVQEVVSTDASSLFAAHPPAVTVQPPTNASSLFEVSSSTPAQTILPVETQSESIMPTTSVQPNYEQVVSTNQISESKDASSLFGEAPRSHPGQVQDTMDTYDTNTHNPSIAVNESTTVGEEPFVSINQAESNVQSMGNNESSNASSIPDTSSSPTIIPDKEQSIAENVGSTNSNAKESYVEVSNDQMLGSEQIISSISELKSAVKKLPTISSSKAMSSKTYQRPPRLNLPLPVKKTLALPPTSKRSPFVTSALLKQQVQSPPEQQQQQQPEIEVSDQVSTGGGGDSVASSIGKSKIPSATTPVAKFRVPPPIQIHASSPSVKSPLTSPKSPFVSPKSNEVKTVRDEAIEPVQNIQPSSGDISSQKLPDVGSPKSNEADSVIDDDAEPMPNSLQTINDEDMNTGTGTEEESSDPIPPPPPALPSLPSGWIELTAPGSDIKYYYNQETKETTWERPLPSDFVKPPLPPAPSDDVPENEDQECVAETDECSAALEVEISSPEAGVAQLLSQDIIPTPSADHIIPSTNYVSSPSNLIPCVETDVTGVDVSIDIADQRAMQTEDAHSSTSKVLFMENEGESSTTATDKQESHTNVLEEEDAKNVLSETHEGHGKGDEPRSDINHVAESQVVESVIEDDSAAFVKPTEEEFQTEEIHQSDLPTGWSQLVDTNTGQTYYYHEADNISTWDRPVHEHQTAIGEMPPVSRAESSESSKDWVKVSDVASSNVEDEKSNIGAGAEGVVSSVDSIEKHGDVLNKDEAIHKDESHSVGDGIAPSSLCSADVKQSSTVDDSVDLNQAGDECDGAVTDGLDSSKGWVEVSDPDLDRSNIDNLSSNNKISSVEVESTQISSRNEDTSAIKEINASSSKDAYDMVNEDENNVCDDSNDGKADLPAGWIEVLDEHSGRTYYYHKEDNITTWDRPTGVVEETVMDSVQNEEGETKSEIEQSENNNVIQSEEPLTRNEQNIDKHVVESDGHDMSGADSSTANDNQMEDSLPEGWTQHTDVDSGLTYYYHREDNITSWEKPAPVVDSKENFDASEVTTSMTVGDGDNNQDSTISVQEDEPANDEPYKDFGLTIDDSKDLAHNEPEVQTNMKELPKGWVEATDPDSGLSYYYHKEDNITKWERPMADSNEIIDPSEVALNYNENEDVVDNDTTPIGDAPKAKDELIQENSDVMSTDLVVDSAKKEMSSASFDGFTKGSGELDNEQSDFELNHAGNNITTWERPVADPDDDNPSSIRSNENATGEDIDFSEMKNDGAIAREAPAAEKASDSFVEEPTSASAESKADNDGKDLPEGWTELVDADSGLTYYHHEGDNITTWDRPVANSDKIADVAENKDLSEKPEEENKDVGEGHEYSSMASIGNSSLRSTQEHEGETKATTLNEATTLNDLPEGWVELTDTDSGLTYYYHKGDNITSWEKPVAGAAEALSVNESSMKVADDGSKADETKGKSQSADISNQQIQHQTSKETEDNLDQQDTKYEVGSESKNLPDGWVELTDESSGLPYYYHEVDNITTWDKPVDNVTPDAPSTTSRLVVDDDEGKSHQEKLHDDADDNTTLSSLKSPSLQGIVTTKVDDTGGTKEQDLPEGWIKLDDPSTGTPYYFNETKNLTTWDHPQPSSVQKPSISIPQRTALRPRPAHAIASFGFGGRLCIMKPQVAKRLSLNTGVLDNDSVSSTATRSWRKGPVVLHRLSQLLEDIHLPFTSSEKEHLKGPMATCSDTDILSYLKEKAGKEKDDYEILWSLTFIAARWKGKLRSANGPSDRTGPEAAIIQLLLQDESIDEPTSALLHDLTDNDNAVSSIRQVQGLLLRGEREKAVTLASSSGNHALALLIASVCDHEIYQNAARRFADEALQHGTPLHTVATLFANQIQPGDKSCCKLHFWSDSDTSVKAWRCHLASILSNQTQGWKKVVVSLGDHLLSSGRVHAAHFCYMVSGCPISVQSDPTSRLVLVGSDHNRYEQINLLTAESLESYKRTEAIEWAKRKSNPQAAISAFQPYKLRYAAILADYGYEELAKQYTDSIRRLTGLEISERTNTANKTKKSASLYSNEFSQSLDIFEDRLLVSMGISKVAAKKRSSKLLLSNVLGKLVGSNLSSSTPDNNSNKEKEKDVIVEQKSPEVDGKDDLIPPIPKAFEEAKKVSDPPKAINLAPFQQFQSPPDDPQQTPTKTTTNLNITKDESSKVPIPLNNINTIPGPGTNVETSVPTFEPRKHTTEEKKVDLKTPAPVSAPVNVSKTEIKSPSSAPPKTKETPKESAPDSGKGFLSWFTKKMNPDATIADTGKSMEAYYDKKLGRWIFPGQDPDEVAAPLPPPPTSVKPKPAAEGGQQNETSSTPKPAAAPSNSDPLSSLMAPPSRRGTPATKGPPGSYSSQNMMTPPTRLPMKSNTTPNTLPSGTKPAVPDIPQFTIFSAPTQNTEDKPMDGAESKPSSEE